MKLFVYGTLQFPEILNALLKTIPNMTAASATGYRAACLKDRMYPGLIKDKNSTVNGFVLELTNQQYKIISSWEDEKYIEHYFKSTEINVKFNDTKKNVPVFYWSDLTLVLDENWDKDKFYKMHIDEYLNRIDEYLTSSK